MPASFASIYCLNAYYFSATTTLSKSFFGASYPNRPFPIPCPGSTLQMPLVGKLLARIKKQMLQLLLQHQRLYPHRCRVQPQLSHIKQLNLMQRTYTTRMCTVLCAGSPSKRPTGTKRRLQAL